MGLLLQVSCDSPSLSAVLWGSESGFWCASWWCPQNCHSNQYCWDRYHYSWCGLRNRLRQSQGNKVRLGVMLQAVPLIWDIMWIISLLCRYAESSQLSCLEEVFVSKASAKQRQGRAGRVRKGFCFRTYTLQKWEDHLSIWSDLCWHYL